MALPKGRDHPTGLTRSEYHALLDAACNGSGPLIIRSPAGAVVFKPVLVATPINAWAFNRLRSLRELSAVTTSRTKG